MRLPGREFNANEAAGQIDRNHPYIKSALDAISRGAGLVSSRSDVEAQVRQELMARLDQWLARAAAITGGARLGYEEERDGRTRGLLKHPTSTGWDDFTCLNSLRDVEPGIQLILKDHGMDREPDQPITDETTPEGQA